MIRRLAFLVCLLAWAGAAQAQTAEKHALLIGIDAYKYPSADIRSLRYAIADAEALEQALTAAGYFVTRLIEGDAEREDLVAALARYALTLGPEDTFVLYYAGHGVRNKSVNERTYWLPYDATLARLEVDGIRLPHLADYISDIKARRKLILLDHCFSGDLVQQVTSSETDGSRGETVSVTLDTSARGGFSIDDFGAPAESSLLILAASRRDAYEAPELGHGVFTAALLDALQSSRADANGDAKLSIDELRAFLRTEVPALSERHVGAGQDVVERAVGSFSGWYVAENLSAGPGGIEPIVERYKGLLTTWQLQGLIQGAEKTWYYQQLAMWRDSAASGQALPDREQRLITAIRQIFDAESASERNRAEQLIDLYRQVGGGQ